MFPYTTAKTTSPSHPCNNNNKSQTLILSAEKLAAESYGRLNSTNENDHHYNNNTAAKRVVTDKFDSSRSSSGVGGTPEEEAVAAGASKRHSLRSTSSFCDEIFLEELANVGAAGSVGGGGGSGSEDDAVSYGAFSLGATSGGAGATASVTYTMAVNSIVGFDEDLFKYHSRLSMTVTSIVNEPNCLSYFVQFLDQRNALPLIKFYLDTENFKNAALAQLRKEHKIKLTTQQIPEEETDFEQTQTLNDTDDQIQNKQQQQQSEAQTTGTGEQHINNNTIVSCSNVNVGAVGAASNKDEDDDDNSNVPELKTLCDLTMRKPLTDDEKSQIYAETNKHIISSRNNERYKLQASSELSLCSLTSNLSEINETAVISNASVKDALTIYQKYLIQDANPLLELPVDILSKISLIICKKDSEEDQHQEGCTSITADCFLDAQHYVINKLEKVYLNDFLQSTYYAKYCVELIDGHHVNINDILHSEVTLFYFMEYLEQHQERDCLDFWSTAINYRKSYSPSSPDCNEKNEKEAQTDAMIIYEKFFSLQSEMKLWSSNKLRAHVEACICTEGMVHYCFDLPLKVGAKYLERKYLKSFLKSSLFSNYMNELKTKMHEDFETTAAAAVGLSKYPAKLALRRCVSDKTANRHRKTLSDCTLDKKVTISQHNTLLAAMDSQHQHQPQHHHYHSTSSTAQLKQFQLNIDSSQLTNPDLLWHRSNSNNLKFGRVNSLGRYERDFVSPSDALHTTSTSALKSMSNWSLSLNGTKLKNAMRKLVHLPEDNVQEEIAWQVAEMIVKDVTSITMGAAAAGASTNGKDKKQKIYLINRY